MADVEDDEAFEWAARQLHETQNGDGSWRRASSTERSHTRMMIRVVLTTLEKRGWKLIPKGGR